MKFDTWCRAKVRGECTVEVTVRKFAVFCCTLHLLSSARNFTGRWSRSRFFWTLCGRPICRKPAGQDWVAVIKAGGYQSGDNSCRSAFLQGVFSNWRKGARQTLLKMILHGARQVKFNSEVFHIRFEGVIATPDLCRISPTSLRQDEAATAITSVLLLLSWAYSCSSMHYKVWIFNTLIFFLVMPHLFSVSTSLWEREKGRAILLASAAVAATAALRSPTTVSLSVCKV